MGSVTARDAGSNVALLQCFRLLISARGGENMKYTKPLLYTMSDDELAEFIVAGACSTYGCYINCNCGGSHNPPKKGNS